MNLDNKLFDTIQTLAEESPRRRMHYYLRTEADAPAGIGHENWKDMSQRILNVMMPDTDVPIHKHSHTSEAIIICRGKVRCECYAEDAPRCSSICWRPVANVPDCRSRWESTIRQGASSQAGIEPVLLKGQGLSRYSPTPELLQCGDIDIYVGEENYEKAYDAILPIVRLMMVLQS